MKHFFTAIVLLIFLPKSMFSGQTITQYYDVIHNEKVVGSLVIQKIGDEKNFDINLKMSADLNILIKKVIILGKENCQFENGILKSSSVLRKVNGKIKTNNWTKFNDFKYALYDGNSLSYLLPGEIRNNMMSIFFKEPVDIAKVYSDNQQKFVEIKEIYANTYAVRGKNESHTTYIFKGGQCRQVILKSNLINLTLKRR